MKEKDFISTSFLERREYDHGCVYMALAVVGTCHSSSCSLFPFSLKVKPSKLLAGLFDQYKSNHNAWLLCYMCVVVWYIIMALEELWSGGKLLLFLRDDMTMEGNRQDRLFT